MPRTPTGHWPCSIARSVDLLGDPWVLLILRESFYGSRRFEQFVDNLGINRATLTRRLGDMVDSGLLSTRTLPEHAGRREYLLTDMGRDTLPLLLAIMSWGDRWLADEEGPPVAVIDPETGTVIDAVVVDATTGQPIPDRIRAVPLTEDARLERDRRASG